MPRVSSAPGAFLDPNKWAANAPAEAALFGLRMLAPNTASLLLGEPAPPSPNFPQMPGKIPSTSDPRIAGALGEVANLGVSLLPFPAAGLSAARTGRGILGLLRGVGQVRRERSQAGVCSYMIRPSNRRVLSLLIIHQERPLMPRDDSRPT